MPLSERPGCRELSPKHQSLSFITDDDGRVPSTRLYSKPHPSFRAGDVKSRKRKDTFDREEQRKAKLENDPWSDKTRLTPKSVFCLGCKQFIRLDRRNDYYPGLWLKHRASCLGIARAVKETNERRNKKYSKPPIDDEQAARILVEMMIRSRCFSHSDTSISA
ncbi:hypothetical protein E1B28_006246 [Marasmius oreades]|uniref:Uncharacterized protein n=1 Tax=Marasmius oreades TaxID=181124 RepID=A0A9P7UV30_9AGAR|nr:uncharacterized protein E1B28_006246 [Marasmius oreades]KAG7095507.1 hypothetical protein E1B28_006246 [Marasmius oreades]